MAKLSNFIEKERSLWTVMRFVFRESLAGSRKYSIVRYVAAVFSALFSFAEFGAVGIIVNEFATHGVSTARPVIIFYGFVLLAASHFVPEIIGMVIRYVWATQNNDLSRHFQAIVFNKMNELDIGTIEQPETQNLINIANNRGWTAFFKMVSFASDLVRQITSVIASAIALVIISPIGFLIIFIGALPTYFVERRNSILQESAHREYSEHWRVWTTKTQPILHKDPLTELKNFSLVNIFKKKFLVTITAFHEKIKSLDKDYLKNDGIAQVILTTAFLVAFGLLISKVYKGLMPIGTLVFSLAVVSKFQISINQIFDTFGKMVESKKHLDTVMDFFEMKPVFASGGITIDPGDFKSLEIKNVSFMYPGTDKAVISKMSLIINKLDNVAIVGLNGAGKTTLIKLLTRVYDPTQGEILVNGISLKKYDIDSWKKCIGILLQEYTIYSEETIAENIMLGNTLVHDKSKMEFVAQETTAHEFIKELPDKYQQRIGTEFLGGVELSKGQKQKLALARVLYRDAPIIILDEPTAAIDALSEDVIFKNLKMNHTHQTRIIISHKFSNVRDADKIILIEHGKIIEQGNHDELMSIETGKYRELFNLQAEGYQDKPKQKKVAKPRKNKDIQDSQEVAQ